MTAKYKEWAYTQWQPKARELTHLLSRTTNFLIKNDVTPEIVDGIATNLVELRVCLNQMHELLQALEQKRVL